MNTNVQPPHSSRLPRWLRVLLGGPMTGPPLRFPTQRLHFIFDAPPLRRLRHTQQSRPVPPEIRKPGQGSHNTTSRIKCPEALRSRRFAHEVIWGGVWYLSAVYILRLPSITSAPCQHDIFDPPLRSWRNLVSLSRMQYETVISQKFVTTDCQNSGGDHLDVLGRRHQF